MASDKTKRVVSTLGATAIAVGGGVIFSGNQHSVVQQHHVEAKEINKTGQNNVAENSQASDKMNDSISLAMKVDSGKRTLNEVKPDQSNIQMKLTNDQTDLNDLRSINQTLQSTNASLKTASDNLLQIAQRVDDVQLVNATSTFIDNPNVTNRNSLNQAIDNAKAKKTTTQGIKGNRVVTAKLTDRLSDRLNELSNEVSQSNDKVNELSIKAKTIENARQKENETNWADLKNKLSNTSTFDKIDDTLETVSNAAATTSQSLNDDQSFIDSMKQNQVKQEQENANKAKQENKQKSSFLDRIKAEKEKQAKQAEVERQQTSDIKTFSDESNKNNSNAISSANTHDTTTSQTQNLQQNSNVTNQNYSQQTNQKKMNIPDSYLLNGYSPDTVSYQPADNYHKISIANQLDYSNATQVYDAWNNAANDTDKISDSGMTDSQRQEFSQYVISRINEYRRASGRQTTLVGTNQNILNATIKRSQTQSAMNMTHEASLTSNIFKTTPGAGTYASESLGLWDSDFGDGPQRPTTMAQMKLDADVQLDGMINNDADSNWGHRTMLLSTVTRYDGSMMAAAINWDNQNNRASLTIDSSF